MERRGFSRSDDVADARAKYVGAAKVSALRVLAPLQNDHDSVPRGTGVSPVRRLSSRMERRGFSRSDDVADARAKYVGAAKAPPLQNDHDSAPRGTGVPPARRLPLVISRRRHACPTHVLTGGTPVPRAAGWKASY